LNIAVPIKYVADTETIVKIGKDGKSLNKEGVTFVVNPYDEFAIEEALKIKEARGGEVTVITIGDEDASKALRTGMAMGADKALHIKTAAIVDPSAAAKLLSDALKGKNFDLIILGMKAVDDDSGVVGPMLAEYLELPCVTMITKLDIQDSSATARRETENGTEVVETSLPAVLTTQKGLNDPRYPSLKGIMAAKKKPIEEAAPGGFVSGLDVLEMNLPPSRPQGRIVGEGVEAVPELARLLKEEAKVI